MAEDTVYFRGGKLVRKPKVSAIEQQQRDAAAEWHPVTSSNVAAIKWTPSDGLDVRFNSGQLYGYPDCPREKFTRMLTVDSPGKFLNAEVIPFYPHVGPK